MNIKAIRARHAAATEGPWDTSGVRDCKKNPKTGNFEIDEDSIIHWPIRHVYKGKLGLRTTEWIAIADGTQGMPEEQREANAKFIAHSWQDVKDLLDALDPLYQVWATQGQGPCKIGEFVSLELALDYVNSNKGGASFGIKYPDGTWHEWGSK